MRSFLRQIFPKGVIAAIRPELDWELLAASAASTSEQ